MGYLRYSNFNPADLVETGDWVEVLWSGMEFLIYVEEANLSFYSTKMKMRLDQHSHLCLQLENYLEQLPFRDLYS